MVFIWSKIMNTFGWLITLNFVQIETSNTSQKNFHIHSMHICFIYTRSWSQKGQQGTLMFPSLQASVTSNCGPYWSFSIWSDQPEEN